MWFRGLDTQRTRLGVPPVCRRSPWTVTKLIQAKPFENRYILDQVPDFYERLKSSYDEKFYAQEVLGEYLAADTGLVYHAFSRTEHVGNEDGVGTAAAVGGGFQRGSDVFGCGAEAGRQINVLDEIVISRASTWQACEEFWDRFQRSSARA